MRLYQTILTFSLIGGLLGTTFLVPLAYIDFELRKEFIVNVLCRKREEVVNTCNGKCFLKQRLSQAGQKQDAANKQLQERYQITFFKQEIKKEDVQAISSVKPNKFPSNDIAATLSSHSSELFRPPRIS